MVSNELSGHLSDSLESCSNIEVGAQATYLPPGFTYDGVREGPYVTGDLHSTQMVHMTAMLQVHEDDAHMLFAVQLDDLRFFSVRSEFIFQLWDTFHACTNISDVKNVLEQMSGKRSMPTTTSSSQCRSVKQPFIHLLISAGSSTGHLILFRIVPQSHQCGQNLFSLKPLWLGMVSLYRTCL